MQAQTRLQSGEALHEFQRRHHHVRGAIPGFELLKNIRADDGLKSISVLMVTAEAKKEDIVLAAQSGAADYIVKPFTKPTLEEKVRKIMQKVAA